MNLAIIKTGGKQYKVKEGDVLKVEKVKGKAGDKVEFKEVLLISDEKGTKLDLGKPVLKSKKVTAEVIEQGRARKVTVIKYKPKTRYKVKQGHRQHYTKVKIGKIS